MYTQDRLSYINIGNEEEIMDIIRDNGATSISEAAEYWYDQKVANVIDMIISRFSK